MQRDYESSLKELESIIKDLESKNISLEESIKKYERGIELYRYLDNVLKEYEGKVKTIIKENKDVLEGDWYEKFRRIKYNNWRAWFLFK